MQPDIIAIGEPMLEFNAEKGGDYHAFEIR